MVTTNPSAPEVLGHEWFATHDQKSRVWAGAPGRMMRIPSTVTETISRLHLSASVDPLSRASVPTVVDIIEEGSEFMPLQKLAMLATSTDRTNEGWISSTGATTNLWSYIDDDTTRWPNPGNTAQTQWIYTTTAATTYVAGVDTTLFSSGAAQNGRIYWVGVQAILAANTGYRKLGVRLKIAGNLYEPAGGAARDVHGYGAIYYYFWGEINPATSKPWLPADIAKFGTDSTYGIKINSGDVATADQYPQINALSLNVAYAETENRKAVCTWRRPNDIGTERLINIATDSLLSVPAGATSWAKGNSKRYLFYWRQSVSPSQYGPTVADDVRWNGAYQELGPSGIPADIAYPYYTNGTAPPPSTTLASDAITYDQYGRPQEPWDGESRAAYAISIVRSDSTHSVDGQPYRMDLADLVLFNSSSQTTGQLMTPGSTTAYAGIRMPIVPSFVYDDALTVRIYPAAAGSAALTGSLVVSQTEFRASVTPGPGSLRYLTGAFSSAITLTSGTQYLVKLTSSTATGDDAWVAYAPDCSLAPTLSFGSTSNCAVIAGTTNMNRDMCINLIRAPNPATSVVAATTNLSVSTPTGGSSSVQHVRVTWVAPVSALGVSFKRYELERQLTGELLWTRVANVNNSATLGFTDHLVPRETACTYRVRCVALDGRVSTWATSNSVTPVSIDDCSLVLTSNHSPSLEVVMNLDREVGYDFLSTSRDEVVSLYGSDNQVVFMESEDRGVGWKVGIEVSFGVQPPALRAGQRIFDQILAITRSSDIPFVAAMDFQGTRILGHVTPENASQRQPGNWYHADLNIIPTHTTEIAVEVS